ncbi:MAG TPA: DUF411 domain-containing protein [Gemmatimonadaceae bacterium]|nr:DUF411 domain-containing protein [Gemmatimonadaceae bacterium]
MSSWTRVGRGAALGAAMVLAAACGRSGGESTQESAAGAAATGTTGGGLAAEVAAAQASASQATTPTEALTVTVYKSPTCGCCKAWVTHMEQAGFRVVAIDTNDLSGIKERHGVRPEHGSCHTATVGDYVLEGHVPAADVKRLLAEKPKVTGLAVPGMPQGSPGMETGAKDPYEVIAFTRGGGSSVFAKY